MIRIHIRRKAPEESQKELILLINQLRSMLMGNPGYLSGETLKRIDKPGETLVISKWQSHFYWNQWYESKERSQIQEKIDQLMGVHTEYEIYEYE